MRIFKIIFVNRENGTILASAAIIKGSFAKDPGQEIQFFKTIFSVGVSLSCKDKLVTIPGTEYYINCSDAQYILPQGNLKINLISEHFASEQKTVIMKFFEYNPI